MQITLYDVAVPPLARVLGIPALVEMAMPSLLMPVMRKVHFHVTPVRGNLRHEGIEFCRQDFPGSH